MANLNIWYLVALNDFNRFILFLSVSMKPLYTVIMVTIRDISKAIIIIDLILAPKKIIIIGPMATFGRLFIIVKYGSITLYRKLFHHKMMAMVIPRMVPREKLIIVSYIVVHIWMNRSSLLYRFMIVVSILLGEDDMNGFMISLLASNSHDIMIVSKSSILNVLMSIFLVLFFLMYFWCSILYIYINILPYFVVVVLELFLFTVVDRVLFVFHGNSMNVFYFGWSI